MNWYYRRKTIDGVAGWEKVKFEELPNGAESVEKIFHPGTLQFDPEKYQEGDMIEVTHHPPIIPENCRPLEELIEQLKQLPLPPFRPHIFYNSYWPGGMLEVIWSDEPYYVEYDEKNKHLVYCRTFDERKLIGVKIEDVASIKIGLEQCRD
jgi:hypothetical protein